MMRRRIPILAMMVVALSVLATASGLPVSGLYVDLEPNEALAVDSSAAHIGWALPPGVAQASFSIRLQQSGTLVGEFSCNPEVLDCSQSDAIPLAALTGPLAHSSSFAFQVKVNSTTGGAGSAWSDPFHFATALPAELPWPAPSGGGSASPVWAANATQNFVMLRRSFAVSASGEHLLSITAKGVPNRVPRGGENATKLLCAYKLWVNGMPVAVGPGRPIGNGSTIQNPAQQFDTVNVTGLLRVGGGAENVIAISAFYWNNQQEKQHIPATTSIAGDHDDMGGVLVLLRSGSAVVTATGDGGWLSFDRGDAVLSPWTPTSCDAECPHKPKPPKRCNFCYFTGGRFNWMHEHWDMRVAPQGWHQPGFTPDPAVWSPAVRRAAGFRRLAAKQARAISLVPHAPLAVRAVTPSGEGSFECAAGGGYCYVIDMGKEVQGGVNVTFKDGVAGHQVSVRASEVLLPSGAVQAHGTDESFHYNRWTLADGAQAVVSHEYVEARWWQVGNAPEPPGASNIMGWKTWYPYEAAGAARDDEASGTTSVSTDSAALGQVWELCRYTGRVGAMDVNTDR
jgi:hypothetical protein